MRSALACLLIGASVPAWTKPITASPMTRRQDTVDLNDDQAICSLPKTADTWNKYGMDQWLTDKANGAQPFDGKSFYQILQDALPDLGVKGYKCGYRNGDCDPARIADQCVDDPKASLALFSVTNLIIYMEDLYDMFDEVVETLIAASQSFPQTFNPKNITTEGGADGWSGAGTALSFAAAVAAFAPGLGLVSAAGSAAGTLNKFSAAAYAAGGAANLEGLTGGGGESIEVQFLSAANIIKYLGDTKGTMSQGFRSFFEHHLHDVPATNIENSMNHRPYYSFDPTELPQLLAGGQFIEPHDDFSVSMMQNMSAALAGPGINTLWSDAGVVIAKVNRDNLPIDPCDGDTLFPADIKYCDADGNMFLIQAPIEHSGNGDNPGRTDPTKYAVPGFENLADWNITVQDVTQSAWKNQLNHDSKGPDPKEFMQDLADRAPTSLAREDYLFFSMPVCDFDKNPINGITERTLKQECGKFEEKNAMCYFYANLVALCPCQYYQGQPWSMPKAFSKLKNTCPRLAGLPATE